MSHLPVALREAGEALVRLAHAFEATELPAADDPLLDRHIASFASWELPARVRRSLCHGGMERVRDVVGKDAVEFLALRGFGRQSLRQLNEFLESKKLEPIQWPWR